MASTASGEGGSLLPRAVHVLPAPGRHRRRGRRVRQAQAVLVALLTLALLPGVWVGLAVPVSAAVGVISAYAGTGTAGYTGDNGPATDAQLFYPYALASAPDGSVYLSDANNRIRRIAPGGTITTIAGTGGVGTGADGGPALTTPVSTVYGLAVDGAGNVYFSQRNEHVVRRIDAVDGTVSLVAGVAGQSGYNGDNRQAVGATLYQPNGLAVEADGDLLVAEGMNRRVRRISAADGTITTVAGTGQGGVQGEGGPATSARVGTPFGLALDAAGTLYVSDTSSHRVLKVENGVLTRLAGKTAAGVSADGGQAYGSALDTPTGLAAGGGSVFLTEYGGHRVRRVSADGILTTVAGTGDPTSTGNDGPGTAATVHAPLALALTPDGDLLEAEVSAHVVRSVAAVVPPVPPTLTGSVPGSPGSDATPTVRGTAPGTSTVTLFADPNCATAPRGSGSAAQLAAAGIEVAVPDGATATFWARATSPGGAVSACSSTAVTYTADTSAPAAPVFQLAPPSPSRTALHEWSFSTGEPNLTTTCALTRSGAVVRPAVPCSSPVSVDLTGEPDGDYALRVAATDRAGNASPAAGSTVLRYDTTAPAAPVVSSPSSPSSSPSPAWTFTREPGSTAWCELRDAGGSVTALEPCSSPYTADLVGRAYGDYRLSVTVSDAAGNVSPETVSTAYTFASPEAGQPQLTGFTATPGTAPAVDLSWGFTVGAGYPTTCTLSRDGAPGASAPCTSPYSQTVSDDGSYAFTVTTTEGTAAATHVLDRSAPAAPILTSTPPSLGQSRTVAWAFTAEDGAALTCSLTTTGSPHSWAPCMSPHTATLGSEGSWTFALRATDVSGNAGPVTQSVYTYDATAPAAPTVGLTPGTSSPGQSPTPSWTFTSTGTATCQLSRGSTVVRNAATCTSPISYALDGVDGTYTLSVTDTDAAGNSSGATTSAYALDTTPPGPPVLTRTDPVAGTGATRTPTWSVSSEPGATLTCQLTREGVDIATASPCGPTWTADLAGEPDGTYRLSAVATDLAGNTGTASASSVTLDTTAPPAPTVTAGQTSPAATRTLRWAVAPQSPDDLAQCRLVPPGSAAPAWADCLDAWPLDPSAADGTYTLRARLTDAAGHTGPETTATQVLDTTAPGAATFTATPASPSRSAVPQWSFTTETGATVRCQLTRGGALVTTATACTSPVGFNLTAAPDGDYTVTVQATDAAGNVGTLATSPVLRYDTTAPSAPVVSSPTSPGSSPSPTWTFTREAGTTAQCQLRSGGAAVTAPTACTSPYTADLTTPGLGSYTLAVTATDAAGNRSAEALSAAYRYVAPSAGTPVLLGVTATAGQPPAVTLRWSFAVDPDYPATCTLSRDGAPGTATPCTSPHTVTVTADGSYRLTVSTSAGSASATHVLDRIAPAAATITAGPGALGSSSRVAWSFTAEAGAALSCSLAPAGEAGVAQPCTSPYSATLTRDGDWTFSVTATDASGNTGPASTRTHRYDSTRPAAPAMSAPGSPGSDTTPTVNVTVGAGERAYCELRAADGRVVAVSSPCSVSWTADLTGQPDGDYVLAAAAVDAAGNEGPEATAEYELLTAAPGAAALTGRAPTSAGSALVWQFTVGPRATAECQLLSGSQVLLGYDACVSPLAFDPPDVGPYTLLVRAVGASGVRGEPVAHTLSVALPSAPPTPAVPAPTASPTATVTPAPTASAVPTVAPVPSRTPPPTPEAVPVVPPAPPSTPSTPSTLSPVATRSPSAVAAPRATPSPSPTPAASPPAPQPTASAAPAATAPAQPPAAAAPAPAPAPRQPDAAPSAVGAVAGEVAARAGEVGEVFADTAKAVLGALSPASLGAGAQAVATFVADLDVEQVAHAAQVAAPKTAFPMGLVLMVGAFLAIQNRIDRNDPKLALAPVHADRHLDFRPPLAGGAR